MNSDLSRRKHSVSAVLTLSFLVVAIGNGTGLKEERQQSQTTTRGEWGDQGNGTYANPVMPGDFSDLDAIRVGADFYAISSTFQFSPGVVVLHSFDMVNWSIAGHVVPDIAHISPEMNWDKMNRNGRGIWAGSIRFHANQYWVYFGTPDEGFFMSTAKNPAGPWTDIKRVYGAPGWDDPCPFWDDDGQGYLVATHFAKESSNGKQYNIHLFRLTPDGERLVPGSDRIIHQSKGSEANKLYKVNGLYYHFFSEVHEEGRVIMMGRAHSLSGPWETRQLIHVNAPTDKEPNQGGLIELASAKWYFVTHQGTGDWEGRAGVLLPVRWVNGWPIIGQIGPDGIGNMVWRGPKPISKFRLTSLVTSDDFGSAALRPEWEWRYQPRADHWSLTERPGVLRLHAFKPLHGGDDFRTAGNVLTQRAMRTSSNEVTVKLDLTGLANGQQAGLAHFAKTFCSLSVQRSNSKFRVVYDNEGNQVSGPIISQTKLWLRSNWGFDGRSRFAFSLDGTIFKPFGEPYQLTWGDYRGDRIGIYTLATMEENGYVDFDDFRYKLSRGHDLLR